MAVHNDTCIDWIWQSAAENMWANFREHFTNAHWYLHELQANTADAGYTANSIYEDTSSQTADVIAQLAATMEED
eukprot:425960-Ditylum_brightwellii.AAC.1